MIIPALRLSLAAPALRAELVAIDSLLAEVLADPGLSGDLRAKLALRRESSAALLRGTPCGHPLSYARFDGVWPLDFKPHGAACVTCMAPGCGSSFDIPLRSDVADRVRAGREEAMLPGPQARHGGDLADTGVIPFPRIVTADS